MRHLIQRFTKTLVVLAGAYLMTFSVAAVTVTYFHNDNAGTPLVATDASGNVVWKENYRPYGDKLNNQPASANNNLWFTGKPYDSVTGLSYMGARYYDPVLGRFTGTDPKGFNPGNLQSFNRYAYANNNPYKFVDPDGHSPLDVAFLVYDLAKLGAAIGSGTGAGEAAVNVAISAIGVAIPAPGVGEAIKGARAAAHAVEAVVQAAKGSDKAADATRVTEKATEGYKRYTPGGKFSEKTRSNVADAANNKCEYCGRETVKGQKSEKGVTPPSNEGQTDHLVPASKGGTNDPNNARHSCRDCNSKFSDNPKPDPRTKQD